MRTRILILAIPLGLFPSLVAGQAPVAPAAATTAQPPAAATPAETEEHPPLPRTYGSFDFGIRASHLDGDAARYERYRDLGDGLVLDRIRFDTQQRGWMLGLAADHGGRPDQRYSGSAIRPGQVKIWGRWDQIPMLMSRTTRTLFTTPSPGELLIDDAIQTQVQAQPSFLATAVQTAHVFDLESRRHVLEGGVEYVTKMGLTFDANLRQIDRDGAIPFGGSFGHSNVVETIAPVQQNLRDVDSTAEYVHGGLLVRGGLNGSWFHNDVTSLTFDNPFRVSDSASAGSRGRIALAPSNTFFGVNGLLAYKLPHKSRATVYGSVGSLRDDGAPLLPFTVNTAIPVVPLDRATTEGHARTSSINLTFTSRPIKMVDLDVRFRTYDYDNLTPVFLTTQRVGYDNAVSAVTNPALQETEPFGVTRATFDADVRFNPMRAFSGGVGVSHQSEERTHRIFEKSTDNTFRLLFDSVGSSRVTLRSKYEHSQRRGEGDVAAIAAELTAIGEQGGMRHYDVASRDRDRVTITGAVVALSSLSLNGSLAAGKDDYGESLFGLRDNHHRVYSAGVEYPRRTSTGAPACRTRSSAIPRSRGRARRVPASSSTTRPATGRPIPRTGPIRSSRTWSCCR